jgi:hypothetical protein
MGFINEIWQKYQSLKVKGPGAPAPFFPEEMGIERGKHPPGLEANVPWSPSSPPSGMRAITSEGGQPRPWAGLEASKLWSHC